jgi:hypothetical protein
MKRILLIGLSLLSSSIMYAQGIEMDGVAKVEVTPNDQASDHEPLIFELPRYKLSPQAHQSLKQKLKDYQLNGSSYAIQTTDLPRHVTVSMQGMPVLNQGRHGSCVTFAITAAIDATIGTGDYISQLCNLELGSQLAIDGKQPLSGWNGNYASLVLKQIDQFGVLSQNYQQFHGCAGVKEYPLNDEADRGNPMSEAEFTSHSVDIGQLYSWEVLFFNEGWLLPNPDMNTLLSKVKQELAKGHLLTFGVFLDVKFGQAGAMGQYHVPNDTWMLTPELIMDEMNNPENAGHDMVITGYDDEATVVDAKGNINKGIFFLRNSWSTRAGDKGNYYVSYDYFKYLTQEVHVIKLKKK